MRRRHGRSAQSSFSLNQRRSVDAQSDVNKAGWPRKIPVSASDRRSDPHWPAYKESKSVPRQQPHIGPTPIEEQIARPESPSEGQAGRMRRSNLLSSEVRPITAWCSVRVLPTRVHGSGPSFPARPHQVSSLRHPNLRHLTQRAQVERIDLLPDGSKDPLISTRLHLPHPLFRSAKTLPGAIVARTTPGTAAKSPRRPSPERP